MDAYRVSRGIPPFLISVLDVAEPLVFNEQEVGWAPNSDSTFWSIEESITTDGN